MITLAMRVGRHRIECLTQVGQSLLFNWHIHWDCSIANSKDLDTFHPRLVWLPIPFPSLPEWHRRNKWQYHQDDGVQSCT
mmetsp:Transcript_22881/g.40603  ORF Transcript_22881/g.40603 Transcript_22881/m.40603 type:complete len:80 (-) Transcript_22881:620-859(-)